MKNYFVNSFLILPAIVFLMLASTASVSRAVTVQAPYEIGTWEGFRPAAVTYTFDDSLPNQYNEAVPMFHTNGFKMTLFEVTSWVGGGNAQTWSQVQQAALYGDEIGSHTVTHIDLSNQSASTVTNELVNSQSAINSHVTNESCLTVAYPYCNAPNETIVAQYYIAARGCYGNLNSSTPGDFMNINSYILGNAGSYTTGDSIITLANYATNTHSWCVYLIHAIDGDNGYSPLSGYALQQTVNYFCTNQNKFWVETFGNVVRYIKERNASSVTETTNTGTSFTIQVTNNLNNSIYNYPITVRRPLPTNWLWATVAQNGVSVPIQQVVTNNSTNYVMFDVVPNGGDVTIALTNPPGSLQLVIPATATQGQGVLAGQGSITLNYASSNDLAVYLTSSNTNKVTVPSSVVISAGQTNTVFDVTIVNDLLLDGNQSVIITAAATNYGMGQAAILVNTTNIATLTVSLPASATKGAGTLTNAGTVSASSVVAVNYTVSLASSDPSKLTVPSSVVISNGQSSAPFNLTVLSDTLIDGPQVVSVTAHVPTWIDGSNSMTILDNNALPDHFGWGAVPSPQIAGQPFNVTITAYDNNNNPVNYLLPVNLSGWVAGTAPATNIILGPPAEPDSLSDSSEYTLGYSFTPSTNLMVTAVRSYYGDKVSLWTDSGVLLAAQNVVSVPGTWVETPLTNPVVLLAGVTFRIGIHENAGTYYFDDSPPTSFGNGTINGYWYAYGDTFPNISDVVLYYVDVRYGTDVEPIAISPVVSGNFNYGSWSGNLVVFQVATNLVLQSSVSGHSGQSLPFDVQLGAPKVTITGAGGSGVLSWLAAATEAGFILEQTHNLAAGPWTAVTNAPVEVGYYYVLTNTPTATTTFYRLHKP